MDIREKIDFVTGISEARFLDGAIQKPPQSVKIELTSRCNLKCKFCAVRTRKSAGNTDMSLPYFKMITEDMRYCNVREIGLFFLGESFTSPELLIKACDWVKNELKFPYVFLTSNAVSSKPEVVEELMKLGLDSLKWSVNYSDVDQFMSHTGGGKEQYESALSNICKAYYIKKNGNYKTTLSASSILYEGKQKENMVNMLDIFIKPYVDNHYWLPLYQMSMNSEKIKQDLGYIPTHGNMGRIDDKTMKPTREPLPCWTVFTEGHVRVDGNLAACCFGSDEKFDIGWLNGTNFMRIWNDKKLQHLREAQLRTKTEGAKALEGTPCSVCVAY